MKQINIIILLLLATLLFGFAGHFTQKSGKIKQSNVFSQAQIESALEAKCAVLTDYINETLAADTPDSIIKHLNAHKTELQKQGLGLFVFQNGNLRFWTDRDCPISSKQRITETIDIQKLSNGWYVFKKVSNQNIVVVGSVLIKKVYNYKNPYLPAHFAKGFNIPSDFNLSLDTSAGTPISLHGKPLFSIKTVDAQINHASRLMTANLFFAVCILLLLITCLVAYDFFAKRVKFPNLLLFALAADLVLIRWLIYTLNFPGIWRELELFSPRLFAENSFVNSLGDLLLNAIFLIGFAIIFHKHFQLKLKALHNKSIRLLIHFAASGISLLLMFYSLNRFESLINNASIPYNFNNILELNGYSFVGLGIALLFFGSALLIIDKLFISLKHFKNGMSIAVSTTALLIIIFAADRIFIEMQIGHLVYLSIAAIIYLLIWLRIIKQSKLNYFSGLIFILLTSLLITTFFNARLQDKALKQQKVLAMNLSNERDAGAEYFIMEMNADLCNDERLFNLLSQANYLDAETYFKNEYMTGYLETYNFQLSLCNASDSLIIAPDNISVDCHNFFNGIINENGIILPGSDFYFLDNNNGLISYLGKIRLSVSDSLKSKIFVEINSQIQNEGPGYPELLLDKSLMPKEYSKHLAYAKYSNGQLITFKGDYEYPGSFQFNTTGNEYYKIENETWHHLIYQPNPETQIVVSQRKLVFNDYLIFFTYIFFILFMMLNITLLIVFALHYKTQIHINKSFKNRIQRYFVVLISVSIVIIGTISIIFYVQRYREKQKDNIQDKMQSVQIELNHKLGDESSLTQEMTDYMNFLLIKFSNVFYTDINLFSLDGTLLASSRQEVYDQGLVGRRMDPDAFFRLSKGNNGYFVQNESIGEMNYLSAYVPFKNNNNERMAYINLPYFAKQNQFSKEISGLTVALINVYLILFLITVLIAIFISNQLTRPLKMIQSSIREMDITQRSRKIEYDADDELGSLIAEYNRKVDELQESAQRLAQSERESAWREMAKQIAHEIKNPLTPMKLSMQHLERAYKEKDPDLDFMFDKVSRTLVEQIDSLSQIATEFSDFAKIRVSNQQDVDLIERIKSATELYNGLSAAAIIFDCEGQEKAIVKADKEQSLRIFNNLIKNAVQSIPKERNGEVRIKLEERPTHYLITIADNGKGIPKEIEARIFSPNFTTKSSGMGLGLSIVKGIVENLKGKIYYTTEADKGTIFYLEFPKKN
ncbi:MAG: ATP-binding protein [Bacteroidales bacterium]|nr:ATP-binding protein [Bacteroidales bacterium]